MIKYIIAVISTVFILCGHSIAADKPAQVAAPITADDVRESFDESSDLADAEDDDESGDEDDEDEVYDPLEEINRVIFEFNMVVDKILFRPVATVYGELVPSPVRTCVHNVVSNLAAPVVLINDILQLEAERSAETLARFVINSTFGIFGLFDVATEMGITQHTEDFGLTLGSYGVGGGPYLMLPLLGPSNLRDLVGKAADFFMDPFYWVVYTNDWDTWGNTRIVVDALDARTNARNLIDSIEKSLDPYAQTRVLYTQHRQNRKRDDVATNETSDLPEVE